MTNSKSERFPFGSPESRAIARSILQPAGGPVLSQDEMDCLRLYGGAVFLNATTTPDSRDLEQTDAYKRGKEISKRLFGPIVPYHRNPKVQRATCASINFEMAFHREPRAGDILRFEDLQPLVDAERARVQEYIRAWERQLPEMPCPLRVDGERVFRRHSNKFYPSVGPLPPAGEGFHWSEATEFRVQAKWRDVEFDASRVHTKENRGVMPHCTAVVFLGVMDGKHRCKPLDEDLNDTVTQEK